MHKHSIVCSRRSSEKSSKGRQFFETKHWKASLPSHLSSILDILVITALSFNDGVFKLSVFLMFFCFALPPLSTSPQNPPLRQFLPYSKRSMCICICGKYIIFQKQCKSNVLQIFFAHNGWTEEQANGVKSGIEKIS